MGQRAAAGEVIESKYRLERELGAGGMGAVWLATQLMVDRPVAVKLLHPAFVDQDDLQARFEVEAKAIGRLNHPNVITLYDFGFSDDLNAFYTVIEYIDGESLDKRLDRRIPLTEIVEIIRQISLALDHAHHHSILHRDLKPENVMLARMTDGTEMVKVLDFGIARIVKGTEQRNQESHRITKAGEVFGTPAYMSPEQARSVRQLEPPADLYSLGVMFYELVSGGLPFFAHSAFDLLMLHVTKPVPPIRRENVPEELAAIIYRLLEKEPEKRFQSGKALADALDKLDLPDEPSTDDLETGPTLIQKGPSPTIGTPPAMFAPPAGLGAEETNPDSPDFSLPTPAEDALSSDDRKRPTMMLEEGAASFSTGSIEPPRNNRLVGVAALGLVALIVALMVAFALTKSGPVEASAGPQDELAAPTNVEPEMADDEPAEIADAMEKDTPVPIGIVDDSERIPDKVIPAPGGEKAQKPSETDAQDDAAVAAEAGTKKSNTVRKRPRRRARTKKGADSNDALNIRLSADGEADDSKSDDALNKRLTLD